MIILDIRIDYRWQSNLHNFSNVSSFTFCGALKTARQGCYGKVVYKVESGRLCSNNVNTVSLFERVPS